MNVGYTSGCLTKPLPIFRFGVLLEEWRDQLDGMISLIGCVPTSVSPEDAGTVEEEEGGTGGEGGGKEVGGSTEREGGGEEGGIEEERGSSGREEEEEGGSTGGGGEQGTAVQGDEFSKMSLEELCSEAEAWSSSLTYAVDNMDTKRSAEVHIYVAINTPATSINTLALMFHLHQRLAIGYQATLILSRMIILSPMCR